MQTPKLSLVICALALVSTLTIRAADNATQAAARAALAQKLFEIEAQTPTNPPAAAKPMAKAVAAPSVAAEPVLNPISSDAKAKAKAQAKANKLAAQMKAKADADQAAANRKAQKAAAEMAAATKAPVKAQAKAVAPAAVKIEPAGVAKVQPAPHVMTAAKGDNPTQAAARAALAQKLFETSQTQSGWEAASPKPVVKTKPPAAQTQKPKPVIKPVATMKSAPAKPAVAPANSGFAPLVAPASPWPTTKQEKLKVLLAKYQADQITPAEYFNQRAAILAEP